MNSMQRQAAGRARRETEQESCAFLPVFAFVPVQELDCVYEPECGFCRGTLFPALDKPWVAGGDTR